MKTNLSILGVLSIILFTGCSNDSSEEPVLRQVVKQKAIAGELKAVASNEQLLSYLRNGVLVNTIQSPAFHHNQPAEVGALSDSNSGFSETNLQVAGVDESDVVKYDGNHLFVALAPHRYFDWESSAANSDDLTSDDFAKVKVLATTQNPASTTLLNKYQLSEPGVDIDGFYLTETDSVSTLSVVTRTHQPVWAFDIWYDPWYWVNGKSGVHLLDVSNADLPNETFKVEIEGHLIDSRRVDDKVYLVTRYTPFIENLTYQPQNDEAKLANQIYVDSLSLSDLLPKVKVNDGEENLLVNAVDCYIPGETANNEGYATIVNVTTIDINTHEVNSKCISGYSDGIFVSTSGIYLLASGAENTAVHKLNYSAANIEYLDTAYVKGNLGWRNPSFRLGEFNHVLSILSSYTDADTSGLKHQLTLLSSPVATGEKFQQLSTLPNENEPQLIGKPGEDIYAVRYVGERGYAVTFEQIDPLYVFDLSDTSAPKIAGELEVDGVSQQLHPIGNSFLVGIGHDATGNSGVLGGIKVELFDVRDMSDIKSVSRIIYGKHGSNSVATFDYHAFSFLSLDENNHRLAIPVATHADLPAGSDPDSPNTWYNWTNFGLQLIDINTADNPTMSATGALITSTNTEQDYPEYDWNVRSVLHGDSIYFSTLDKVWSADWSEIPNE